MKRTRIAAGVVLAGAVMWLGTATAQPDDPYAEPPPAAAPPPAPRPAAPPPAPRPAAPPPAPAPAPAAPPAAPPAAAPAPAPEPAAPAPAEEKDTDEKDTEKKDADQGALPPGHPPIAPSRPNEMTAEQKRDLMRRMLQRKREMEQQQGGPKPLGAPGAAPAAATPTAPPKAKYPVDEHGYCIGDGPNDRPQDINLFHGWLGVNNEKAVPAPRPKGSEEWWKWRLTPYPYRYENHDDHCDPQNEPIPLIANIVNVGVLLFILVRFGRRPVGEALKKRRANVMADVERARDIKKAAEKRLRQYEEEYDQLDDKLDELQAQYRAEGEVEEKRARQEAAETRERMLADAAFRISQEGKTLRDDLSRQALEDALVAADELLTGAVTTADHDRLEEEYLTELSGAIEKGGANAAGSTA